MHVHPEAVNRVGCDVCCYEQAAEPDEREYRLIMVPPKQSTVLGTAKAHAAIVESEDVLSEVVRWPKGPERCFV